MNNIPVLIAQKEIRDRRRYKQKDIAEATQISESMISRVIQDKINIGGMTLDTAFALADWLGCDIRDLVIREES
jgi:transcriptional regulator with XRE-family HTH domain